MLHLEQCHLGCYPVPPSFDLVLLLQLLFSPQVATHQDNWVANQHDAPLSPLNFQDG